MRTPHAAVADLAVIAARPGRNQAHVSVTADRGEHVRVSGVLSVHRVPPDDMRVTVDEREVITVPLDAIRGAWLHSFDGADYYSLRVDVGWAIVTVCDAYNGL